MCALSFQHDGAGAESAAEKLSAPDVESQRLVCFMHIPNGFAAVQRRIC